MKKQNRVREIRLARRAEERIPPKRISIVTDLKEADNYVVTNNDVDSAQAHKMFEKYRKEYSEVALRLVLSHMGMSTAIHNVFAGLKNLLPDGDTAPGISDAIDSAWDLAASSMLLETALQVQGYQAREARVFAQAILLKRSELPAASAQDKPKKPQQKPEIEELVEAVRADLGRLGIKISKAENKEQPVAPTRRSRKQG